VGGKAARDGQLGLPEAREERCSGVKQQFKKMTCQTMGIKGGKKREKKGKGFDGISGWARWKQGGAAKKKRGV